MADLGGDPTAQLIEPSMPTQDAIALTEFLAETVKGYVRFLPGPDTVGGSTDVAVVTKHEGFKWIRRKHYYPPSLNVETDHV
jgi:ABC-type branched-subunit amino acid transport system substrate-binding protein